MFLFKIKRKQQSHKLQPCRHGETARCKDCGKKDTGRCTVKKVLTDASVLLAVCGEEINTQYAEGFLRQNRQKYRIVTTPEILGEVLKTLITEARERAEAAMAWYAEHLNGIEVVGAPFDNNAFMELLSKLTKSEVRCGLSDRINVAVAVHCKIPFFYFDSNLDGDIDTINKIVRPWGKLDPFRYSDD